MPERRPETSLPELGQWVRLSAFAMLVAVPYSAAAVNVFGTLVLLLAFASREFWQAVPKLARNPVVLSTLLLLVLMLAGLAWTSAPPEDAWGVVRRYRKLLYIPVLLPFFREDAYRMMAARVFACAVAILVLCSFSEWLGLTHFGQDVYWNTPPGDSVFGSHITQGYMISLMMACCLPLCLRAGTIVERRFWALLALLGAIDIGVVMIGRTGKAILPLLLLWGVWEVLRIRNVPGRKIAASLAGCAVLAGTGVYLEVSNPHTSLGTVVTQVETSQRTGERTSQGERMEYYRKSLALISASPLIGHGTGSLRTETGRIAAAGSTDVGRMVTPNPHNEYLMWTVQFGAIGLLAFLGFCVLVLRRSLVDAGPGAVALRGAWVIFVSGCLMNSLLLDHLEGTAWVLAVGVFLPL